MDDEKLRAARRLALENLSDGRPARPRCRDCPLGTFVSRDPSADGDGWVPVFTLDTYDCARLGLVRVHTAACEEGWWAVEARNELARLRSLESEHAQIQGVLRDFIQDDDHRRLIYEAGRADERAEELARRKAEQDRQGEAVLKRVEELIERVMPTVPAVLRQVAPPEGPS